MSWLDGLRDVEVKKLRRKMKSSDRSLEPTSRPGEEAERRRMSMIDAMPVKSSEMCVLSRERKKASWERAKEEKGKRRVRWRKMV